MSSSEYNEPLLDVSSTLAILRKKKGVIVISALAFVGCAIAYIMFADPRFISRAIILIDPRETRPTKSENVLRGIGRDSAAIESQVTVIQSTALLKEIFAQHNIASDPEFNKRGILSGIMELVEKTSSLSPAMKERKIFETFRKNVFISREGLTYVLNVSFRSRDREKAARIANSIVKNYIDSQVSERSSANQEVSVLLDSRIDLLQGAVRKAEKNVENFKVRNNIVDMGVGQTMLDVRLQQVNTQWLAAERVARQRKNQYDQARVLNISTTGGLKMEELLTSSLARQLRQTYNSRSASLVTAKMTLGAAHPSRMSLEAEVSHLEKMIKKEAKRIISTLRASKELAQSNADTTKLKLVRLRKKLGRASQVSIQLRQLERAADASRKILKQFLGRSKETGQLGLLQRSNIRILSMATPPLKPSWPRPLLVLAVAGFLGLLFGVTLALSSGRPSTS